MSAPAMMALRRLGPLAAPLSGRYVVQRSWLPAPSVQFALGAFRRDFTAATSAVPCWPQSFSTAVSTQIFGTPTLQFPGPDPVALSGSRQFSTRSLHGRMFYRRRPHQTPRWKFNWRSKWLEGSPQKKGVCTKVAVASPKKPNSGLRKIARVRLSNQRVVLTHIPGIGHNLQVHSVVMVRGGRTPDIPGCNYKCMRGRYDLLPTKNRLRARSKHSVKKPKPKDPWQQRAFKHLTTNVDRRVHFYRTGMQVAPGDEIIQSNYPVLRKSKPFPQPNIRRRRKG